MFMSQIVLYFLHSTSVLSFDIDVVLTLSIWNTHTSLLKDVLKDLTNRTFVRITSNDYGAVQNIYYVLCWFPQGKNT